MSIFENKGLLRIFYELWKHISHGRKIQFICLIPLIFFAGILEAANIGLLMPFIASLSKPSETYSTLVEKFPIISYVVVDSGNQFLYFISAFLVAVTIISTVFRSILIIAQTKISYGVGADLGINIFRKTLYQPYEIHISRNSSEVISVISNKASLVVVNAIYPAINVIASLLISILVIFTLVYINPLSAIVGLASFGCVYAIIILFARKKISSDSKKISKDMNQVVKLVQEGLGGIRDILIDRTQSVYVDNFSYAERNLRNSLANIQLISTIPRLAIESSAIILIVLLALVVSLQTGDVVDSLPFIGIIALGGQRLLPLLNQIYVGWASITGSKSNAEEVVKYLNQRDYQPIADNLFTSVSFNEALELKNVCYRYHSCAENVLNNINLKVHKGEVVGIIGTSGSGKSTLLDLILGLINPITGEIIVDGQSILGAKEKLSWQKKIAHVPQNIYLTDATFAENIAFGVPIEQIDLEKVAFAARLAHISNFIEAKSNSYSTMVGERGIQLSGGQLQRIGIARAFYKTSEVIIFDEATSALDDFTESQIFHSISLLPTTATILIVSHRPQTLNKCTKIIELSHGGLIKPIGNLGSVGSNS